MSAFTLLQAERQAERHDKPYDRWIAPTGAVAAEFYRDEEGFLLRFPDQADFKIDGDSLAVRCIPTPQLSVGVANSLFSNAICPLLVNYRGGLNLHASAVSISGRAVAFVGHSRRGKTTLAAAFARATNPLLTEDVLVLERDENRFIVQPTRPILRLFADSASFLFGLDFRDDESLGKVEMHPGETMPFASEPSPLAALFILGSDSQALTRIERVSPATALAGLIQHSFVLDVEDRQRLRAHFLRLSDLAQAVPCYWLDYPRTYDRLSQVLAAVKQKLSYMSDK